MSKPIFSLASFRDFAASKDPNEVYHYLDRDNCACAQYCKSLGLDYMKDDKVSVACSNNDLEICASVASIYSSQGVHRASWGDLVRYLDRVISGEIQPNGQTRPQIDFIAPPIFSLWRA